MNILIVEDDKTAIQTYCDNIELINKNLNFAIVPDIKENLEVALEALKINQYDAAIIDLKLNPGLSLEGIEIVDEIRNQLRFPIFIVSGSIGQISYEENVFFRKRSRDSDFQEILKEIVAIYNTGITKILGKSGQIDTYLNKIFWDHLSNSLDVWIKDETRESSEKERSLLRYTLLHIQEYLELTEESNFEEYLPAEAYITPPIKTKLFTGDIVIDNESQNRFVVLTPSCDMAQDKAKDFLLVAIESINEGIINEKKNIILKNTASKEDLEEAKKTIKSIISNSFSNKYHYLPKYKLINAGLINFQKLKTVRVKDFDKNFSRIASINNSFTKDIVARFSYYYSRQGSPDFKVDEIYESVIKEK